MTNIIDFLIEYKETTEENNSILVANVLDLFFGEKVSNTDNYYQTLKRKGVLKEALSSNIPIRDKDDEENDEIVFYNTSSIANDKIDEDKAIRQFLLRKKVICYLKMKFVDLLINYIYLKSHPKIYEKIESKQIHSFYLFKII